MSLKTLTERFEEVNRIKENNKKIDKAVFNIEDVGDLLISYKNLKEIEKSHKEENGKLRIKLTKQEKLIELIEKECRQRLAFAKRIRRSEKRNPDDFNQGLEFESATIMNLLSGEPHWEYEGKYFDDIDKQVEKLKAEESE